MATRDVNDTGILSDETFYLLCCMCKHKNRNTEATKFCVDCQEYYCSSCVKFHEEIPPLSRHKMLNKEQFQTGQSQRLQIVPTARCDRHRHKHVDMYCQNHDEVGCSTCIAVDHKSCRNTFFVPDFLQSNTDVLRPKDIDLKLGTAADVLTDENAKFEQEKERLLTSESMQLEKIQEFRQKANERLAILEQNSFSEVKAKYKLKLDKLDEQMHQIHTTKGVSKETSSKRQNSANTLLKVKENNQYNVRILSDSQNCNIYSVCVLVDRTIILADYYNSKLKRVDQTTCTVIDYCDVSGDLYQVCPISNQEVAVSCGYLNNIQFVSLGNKLVPTKQIKTNHTCYGLAFVAEQLYISDSTNVYIYTVSGTKLQQFNKDQSGQTLFSSIYSLAVSNDSSKIYVADSNNGLISLGSDGKVLTVFKSTELDDGENVCLTENGNVLVCGYHSKNVVQLTPDCKMIGEILKCDTGCCAICYDAKHSRLIVGLLENDNILVYDVV